MWKLNLLDNSQKLRKEDELQINKDKELALEG